MQWSKLFIPTLREAPAGIASEGARLLDRAGYRRGDADLFLGRRSYSRIAEMFRRELDSLGAQEIYAPRGDMSRLARELRSYKQLPQLWYHFRAGLCIASFELAQSAGCYDGLRNAFDRILRRCGLEYFAAETVHGVRLMVPYAGGGDRIARAGAFVGGLEAVTSEPGPAGAPDPEGDFAPESFHTRNRKTIAELADFTGLPETSHIKSLVMAADDELVMVLLRGDHQMSEEKLAQVVPAKELRAATLEEIRARFGAGAGSLGPVGIRSMRILADLALRGRRNMIAGANRDDYHLRHVTPGEDFETTFFDLREASDGESWKGIPLRIENAVALADLAGGLRRRAKDLAVSGDSGQELPIIAGSYHASIDRILWAAAEQHHDADGLVLPAEIAPFDLIVTPVDISVAAQQQGVERIAATAEAAGLDVLVDDRVERPGVKFKDADLIGVPWRVTIGKKLEQGSVEVMERRSKQKTDVALDAAVEFIRTRR